eukprot:COSAG01_NODE_54155_length_334_cov_0.651064_1_plen_62_part_10
MTCVVRSSYWREHAGNFTTLPEAFKIAGYHSMSFGKIFQCAAAPSLSHSHSHTHARTHTRTH